jgi:hypothetical protein
VGAAASAFSAAVRVLLPLEGHVRLLQVVAVKPNCRRRTDTIAFFSLRQSWEREVTPTILRHMLTLATEFMPALATSRITSASEVRGVGAGAPASARFNLAGTGAPEKLDKISTGAPPSAPPAGEAVEARAGAGGPGLGARETTDKAGAARYQERTGSGAHGDELTHRRHRPWRGCVGDI